MKQIGRTENGDALVQMSWEEWSICVMFDLSKIIEVQKILNDVAPAIESLVEIFSGKKLAAPVKKGKRGPYKKKSASAVAPHCVRQKVKPAADDKKKSLAELALEAVRQNGKPMTIAGIVAWYKSRGHKFTQDDPAYSIGQAICYKKVLVLVGREGSAGLYALPGMKRREKDLTSKEKLLINVPPAELTEEAKQKRLNLLKQLNSNLA